MHDDATDSLRQLKDGAVAPAEVLLGSDIDALYEQLGSRAMALPAAPEEFGQFEPSVVADVGVLGPLDTIRRMGLELFQRWNSETYQLLCGQAGADSEDRKRLREALGISKVELIAVITASLVWAFGLAPAIAIVIATIAVKRFVPHVGEVVCDEWKASLG